MKVFFLALFVLQVPAMAALDDATAISMVPKGKLVSFEGRDYIIKTTAGTKIKVEFSRDGNFDEASGRNLNKGDDFEPGHGLISLSSAAHVLAKSGEKVQGSWTLERDSKLGWVYEIEGIRNDEKKEYLVSAKEGRIIKAEH